MSLRSGLFSFLGDLHVVKALTIPPCFMVGSHRRKLDLGTDYRSASRILKPGDILTSRSWGFFCSNLGIPGSFKHALIYVGPVSGRRSEETGFTEKPKRLPAGANVKDTPYPRSVVHAISEGVVCQDLLEVMAEEDYLAAYRPLLLTERPELAEKVVDAACQKVGTPYDFGFDWRSHDALCCTELADYAVKAAGVPLPPRTKKRLKLFQPAVDVTLSDSYALAHPMVWCSLSCNEPGFIAKSVHPQILRDRIWEADDASSLNAPESSQAPGEISAK